MQQRILLGLMLLSFGSLQAAGNGLNWEELINPENDISRPNVVSSSKKKLHMPLQDITPQCSKGVIPEEKDLTFLHMAVLSGQIKQVERVLSACSYLSPFEQDIKWNAKTSLGRTALQIAKASGNNEIYVTLQAWRFKVTPAVLKKIWLYSEEEEKNRLDLEQEYKDCLRCIKVEEAVGARELKAVLAQKREEEIQKYTKLLEQRSSGLSRVIYKARLEMLLEQRN